MEPLEYLKKYGNPNTQKEDIQKLKEGIPVQYLVGNVDFYGYTIKVNPSVLIPRFETEGLVEKTIQYLKKEHLTNGRVVDLGTGSGCIAIALKKKVPTLKVDAVDISKDALILAKENAKENEAEITFYEGDYLKPLKETYDVVISNPPYIDKEEEIDDLVKNNEPHLALYADHHGLASYETIFKTVKPYLKSHYLLAFEIGYLQKESLKLLTQQFFKDCKIIFETDLQERDRYLFIIK